MQLTWPSPALWVCGAAVWSSGMLGQLSLVSAGAPTQSAP